MSETGAGPGVMTLKEAREQLHGITATSARFDTAAQEKLAAEQPINEGHSATEASTLLVTHGLEPDVIKPEAAPGPYALEDLTEQDWADVAHSAQPYVTLWSRSNYRQWEHNQNNAYRTPRRRPSPEDQVLFESLPLAHGTSVVALDGALEEGEFLSNRALHEKGIDVTESVGSTYDTDRALGLDTFIFADVGRPHSRRLEDSQPEVIVLLDPAALTEDDHAFVTDQDLADCHGSDGHEVDLTVYMTGVHTAADLYAYGVERINHTKSYRTAPSESLGMQTNVPLSVAEFMRGDDGDPGAGGRPLFNPWEAKLSRVRVDRIDTLVFRDQGQYDAFIEKHGDTYRAVYDPTFAKTLKERPRAALNTSERERANTQRHAEQYVAALEADYEHRQQVVAETPPEEQAVSYVIVPNAFTAPPGVDAAALDLRFDLSGDYRYSSMQAAVRGANQEYRDAVEATPWAEQPRTFRIATIRTGNGTSVTEGFESQAYNQ